MVQFAQGCRYQNIESSECNHTNRITTHCVEDRKYCPRVAETDRTDQALWKHDYKKYLEDHDKAYNEQVLHEDNIRKLKLRHKKIDVEKTLAAQRRYWTHVKKGYQLNVNRKCDVLDWLDIYNRAVQRSVNMKTYIKRQ